MENRRNTAGHKNPPSAPPAIPPIIIRPDPTARHIPAPTVDPRHTGLRILLDAPIAARAIDEAMCLCGDPAAMLEAVGQPCLSRMTANDAERLLDLRLAA